MKLRDYVRVVLLAVMAGLSMSVSAATYSYNFSNEFSGGTPPAGPAPWATLTFSDVFGGVELTLSLAAWTGFVSEFDINYGANPGSDAALTPLAFTYISGQAAQSVTKKADHYKADGDGKFDIQFSFPTASGPSQLTGGETVKYLITGSGGADYFNNRSLTSGGNGIWYSALHVQGLPGGGWLGATAAPVPEPQVYAQLLLGLVLLGLFAARRREM